MGDDAVAVVSRDDGAGPRRSPALRSAAAHVPGAENPWRATSPATIAPLLPS